MSTIITKYSDYAIQSIEYFIDQIESEIEYRDLYGLSNNTIEKINVTKQHPLVALMAASLNGAGTSLLRSGILPSVSVTPGSSTDEGFTLGQSYKSEAVDDDFIDLLDEFYAKTNKVKQQDVLLTNTQITTIKNAYTASGTSGGLRVQVNEWRKNEEINISSWSENQDIDILLGNFIDSILASIQVGLVGDNSGIRHFRYKATKGLTNFNFGRVLFGTEFNITLMNTFRNYTIYTDEVLSGHDFYPTLGIPEGDY